MGQAEGQERRQLHRRFREGAGRRSAAPRRRRRHLRPHPPRRDPRRFRRPLSQLRRLGRELHGDRRASRRPLRDRHAGPTPRPRCPFRCRRRAPRDCVASLAEKSPRDTALASAARGGATVRPCRKNPNPVVALPTAADVDRGRTPPCRRRAAHAADLLARARRRDRRARVPQGRDPAAHRLVQVPRRLQQALLDRAGASAPAASSPSPPAITRRASPPRRSCSDMPAVIVMPSDAPRPKRERTARARRRGRALRPRQARTARRSPARIAEKRGAVLVPPYDDPLIIAGQGTAGREIVEDLAALGLTPDVVVVGASRRRADRRHRARRQGARPGGESLCRRAGRLRRHRALVSERQARGQCAPQRLDLRRADVEHAGQDHLRDQSQAGRRRHHRERRGSRARGRVRLPRAEAGGGARRRDRARGAAGRHGST